MATESNVGGDNNNQGRELSSVLDLRMPGDSGAVSDVTDTITATLTKLDVPEEKRMEIALAVQEALVNAAVHGCNNDSSKEVRCRLERDPDGRIVITVTDPEAVFPPDRCPIPSSRKTSTPTTGAAFT